MRLLLSWLVALCFTVEAGPFADRIISAITGKNDTNVTYGFGVMSASASNRTVRTDAPARPLIDDAANLQQSLGDAWRQAIFQQYLDFPFRVVDSVEKLIPAGVLSVDAQKLFRILWNANKATPFNSAAVQALDRFEVTFSGNTSVGAKPNQDTDDNGYFSVPAVGHRMVNVNGVPKHFGFGIFDSQAPAASQICPVSVSGGARLDITAFDWQAYSASDIQVGGPNGTCNCVNQSAGWAACHQSEKNSAINASALNGWKFDESRPVPAWPIGPQLLDRTWNINGQVVKPTLKDPLRGSLGFGVAGNWTNPKLRVTLQFPLWNRLDAVQIGYVGFVGVGGIAPKGWANADLAKAEAQPDSEILHMTILLPDREVMWRESFVLWSNAKFATSVNASACTTFCPDFGDDGAPVLLAKLDGPERRPLTLAEAFGGHALLPNSARKFLRGLLGRSDRQPLSGMRDHPESGLSFQIRPLDIGFNLWEGRPQLFQVSISRRPAPVCQKCDQVVGEIPSVVDNTCSNILPDFTQASQRGGCSRATSSREYWNRVARVFDALDVEAGPLFNTVTAANSRCLAALRIFTCTHAFGICDVVSQTPHIPCVGLCPHAACPAAVMTSLIARTNGTYTWDCSTPTLSQLDDQAQDGLLGVGTAPADVDLPKICGDTVANLSYPQKCIGDVVGAHCDQCAKSNGSKYWLWPAPPNASDLNATALTGGIPPCSRIKKDGCTDQNMTDAEVRVRGVTWRNALTGTEIRVDFGGPVRAWPRNGSFPCDSILRGLWEGARCLWNLAAAADVVSSTLIIQGANDNKPFAEWVANLHAGAKPYPLVPRYLTEAGSSIPGLLSRLEASNFEGGIVSAGVAGCELPLVDVIEIPPGDFSHPAVRLVRLDQGRSDLRTADNCPVVVLAAEVENMPIFTPPAGSGQAPRVQWRARPANSSMPDGETLKALRGVLDYATTQQAVYVVLDSTLLNAVQGGVEIAVTVNGTNVSGSFLPKDAPGEQYLDAAEGDFPRPPQNLSFTFGGANVDYSIADVTAVVDSVKAALAAARGQVQTAATRVRNAINGTSVTGSFFIGYVPPPPPPNGTNASVAMLRVRQRAPNRGDKFDAVRPIQSKDHIMLQDQPLVLEAGVEGARCEKYRVTWRCSVRPGPNGTAGTGTPQGCPLPLNDTNNTLYLASTGLVAGVYDVVAEATSGALGAALPMLDFQVEVQAAPPAFALRARGYAMGAAVSVANDLPALTIDIVDPATGVNVTADKLSGWGLRWAVDYPEGFDRCLNRNPTGTANLTADVMTALAGDQVLGTSIRGTGGQNFVLKFPMLVDPNGTTPANGTFDRKCFSCQGAPEGFNVRLVMVKTGSWREARLNLKVIEGKAIPLFMELRHQFENEQAKKDGAVDQNRPLVIQAHTGQNGEKVTNVPWGWVLRGINASGSEFILGNWSKAVPSVSNTLLKISTVDPRVAEVSLTALATTQPYPAYSVVFGTYAEGANPQCGSAVGATRFTLNTPPTAPTATGSLLCSSAGEATGFAARQSREAVVLQSADIDVSTVVAGSTAGTVTNGGCSGSLQEWKSRVNLTTSGWTDDTDVNLWYAFGFKLAGETFDMVRPLTPFGPNAWAVVPVPPVSNIKNSLSTSEISAGIGSCGTSTLDSCTKIDFVVAARDSRGAVRICQSAGCVASGLVVPMDQSDINSVVQQFEDAQKRQQLVSDPQQAVTVLGLCAQSPNGTVALSVSKSLVNDLASVTGANAPTSEDVADIIEALPDVLAAIPLANRREMMYRMLKAAKALLKQAFSNVSLTTEQLEQVAGFLMDIQCEAQLSTANKNDSALTAAGGTDAPKQFAKEVEETLTLLLSKLEVTFGAAVQTLQLPACRDWLAGDLSTIDQGKTTVSTRVATVQYVDPKDIELETLMLTEAPPVEVDLSGASQASQWFTPRRARAVGARIRAFNDGLRAGTITATSQMAVSKGSASPEALVEFIGAMTAGTGKFNAANLLTLAAFKNATAIDFVSTYVPAGAPARCSLPTGFTFAPASAHQEVSFTITGTGTIINGTVKGGLAFEGVKRVDGTGCVVASGCTTGQYAVAPMDASSSCVADGLYYSTSGTLILLTTSSVPPVTVNTSDPGRNTTFNDTYVPPLNNTNQTGGGSNPPPPPPPLLRPPPPPPPPRDEPDTEKTISFVVEPMMDAEAKRKTNETLRNLTASYKANVTVNFDDSSRRASSTTVNVVIVGKTSLVDVLATFVSGTALAEVRAVLGDGYKVYGVGEEPSKPSNKALFALLVLLIIPVIVIIVIVVVMKKKKAPSVQAKHAAGEAPPHSTQATKEEPPV